MCGGRGVGARGRLRFFRRGFFQFQVSRRVVSVRVLLSLAFAFVLFCFSFLFVCVARAHGCGGRSRVAVARMRALAAVFSCVVLAVWQAWDKAWRLLSSWLSPALMWSTSVARMSHAGWCHRRCPPAVSPLVGGGVVAGSRPAHLYFAFARTCFLSLFQFVGKRWRRLDVAHGMCAGYLVGCGWWGGRRVVGVLALVFGFWLGLGSEVGVSGGWRCLVGGSRFLAGGWCGVWGPLPLDPSLTPPPPAWCAVVLGSGRPSVGWWRLLAGGCLWVAVLFWGGGLVLRVACLAGCVLVGLFSTWGRGCCSRWLLRFGRVFVGACSAVAGSAGCVRVGGMFSDLLCRSRWVGRPGRSGSSSPPSFSPHATRRRLTDPQIQWVNSHVKTLTDRRSSVSGTHTFRLCHAV